MEPAENAEERTAETPLGLPAGFGPSGRAGAPPVQRLRLVFRKGAPLRYIGHLDLARLWERACRRAQLPLAYTLGFTPHPRLTFASPLSLGATSDGELLDMYLREAMHPDELVARVTQQLPAGCSVVSATELPLAGPASSALTRWAEYRVEASALPTGEEAGGGAHQPAAAQGSRWSKRTDSTVAPAGTGPVSELPEQGPARPASERLAPPEPDPPLPTRAVLQTRVQELLAAGALPRQRTRDGKATSYDLRPLVLDIWLEEAQSDLAPERTTLGMMLRLHSSGAGRPDEVSLALGLRARRVHRIRIGLEGDEPARSWLP